MNVEITNKEDAVILWHYSSQKVRKVIQEVFVVFGGSVDDRAQHRVGATHLKSSHFKAGERRRRRALFTFKVIFINSRCSSSTARGPRGVKEGAARRGKLNQSAALTHTNPGLRHTEEVQGAGTEEISQDEGLVCQ